MFLRHFGLMVLFVAAGCGSSHLATTADSGPMPVMGDTGAPVPGRDSGFYEWPDSGPVTADAGSDAGTDAGPTPIVRIVFDGPADSNVLRGTQDNVMYAFSVSSSVDVEIRFLDFVIEGLTAADRTVGSAGTELFRDIKLKDLDTGMTLMGPVTLASGLFTDSFIIHAGETRRFGLTMDISNAEDVPGEFFDGTHRYRVTVGDTRFDHFFQTAAVREVATGVFLGPEVIENNVIIAGNVMTVVDAGLAVSMAASPGYARAVARQPLIPSVGLVFSASAASDVLIRSVRLSGVGNLDGTDAAAQLNDVITSCALFNGDVQVGTAQAPDAVTGTMNIGSVNVTVPAGTSVTLVARCTADSVVTDEYDIYAIGISEDADVVAEREDGSSVFPVVGTSLLANARSSTGNFVLVYGRGVITVAPDNLRQSTILVAGPDVWQNMAQFRLTAQWEDIELTHVRVTSRGEAASFNTVAIASDGVVLGTGILPTGTDSERDVLLTDAFRIPHDGSRTIQIWARISNVVSSASVGGATTGVARSGNRIRLGIAADIESGDWDASYVGMLNMRFTGAVSGDRLYADGPELIGNQFVVRRSKPTFVRQSLSTTTIANGLDMDLYRFQIVADTAGSVGVAGFRFDASVVSTSGTISSLRIRRGSTDIAASDVTITYSGASIVIAFTNEQTITGSGYVYTLHGVVNGFVAGDAISIAPHREPFSPIDTGYVMPGLVLQSEVGTYMPGLLWSDMSEVPHSMDSWDWTGDALVEDLTQTQILTR